MHGIQGISMRHSKIISKVIKQSAITFIVKLKATPVYPSNCDVNMTNQVRAVLFAMFV